MGSSPVSTSSTSPRTSSYFKEQRALRTETTINNPNDFYVAKAVPNLTHLRDLGDQVTRKLLESNASATSAC